MIDVAKRGLTKFREKSLRIPNPGEQPRLGLIMSVLQKENNITS